jgi:hypothetical protein
MPVHERSFGRVGVVFAACALVTVTACRAPQDRGATVSDVTFTTTATIEDIMRSIIDPAADAVWDAVVTTVTPNGTESIAPESSEDWAQLRRHAITLVEVTNLLMVEGRQVAAPGSRSDMPGVDLEPEAIAALLAEDRDRWVRLVTELHRTGVTVLGAVERQDVDALLVAGDRLDLACENCHARYWYPGFAGRPDATP